MLKPVMFWDTSSGGHYKNRQGHIVRGGQWRFGLAANPGRKYIPIVANTGNGVRVVKIEIADKHAIENAAVKTVKHAIRVMRRQGENFGITQEAKRMLRDEA